jgi:hypothetical protein
MNNHDDQGRLSKRQERRWFRFWTAGLIVFFVVAGGASLSFLWLTKCAEVMRHRQLLDPAAPDPGVTAAKDSSSKDATPVEVGCYVERVPELSVREATWTVVFDVWFRWQGDDLKPANRLVVMEGTIESSEKLAEYHLAGNHYERYRIVAKITKTFPAAQMPFDSHLLILAIENGELAREKLIFRPDLENCSVSSRVSIPGNRIVRWQVLEKPHSYKSTRGDPRLPRGTESTFSQFRMGILIERAGWGLYVKLFQALHIAVAIAFLACFIKPTHVDPRFGLGVGALFAAVANSYVVNSLVPDTGEFSLADVVNGLGILTILVTLIESTISLYLFDHCSEEGLSRSLDQMSFKILVTGFTGVNAVLLAAALV